MEKKRNNQKQKLILKFDVMLDERFIHTFRYPLKYIGEIVYQDELVKFVEERMPTLKGKDYEICFYEHITKL